MTDRLVILDTKNASQLAFAVYHTGTRSIYSDYSDIDPNSQVHTSSSSRSHHAISRSSPIYHQRHESPLSSTRYHRSQCLTLLQHQPPLSHTRLNSPIIQHYHHFHVPLPNNPHLTPDYCACVKLNTRPLTGIWFSYTRVASRWQFHPSCLA